MNLIVLDESLQAISILDGYNSLIWTDRYSEAGDFEIYTRASKELFETIKLDYFLQRTDSEHIMIVEKIATSTDVDEGNMVTITGRSLESILDRRIIWGEKNINSGFQDGIKTLITENFINPSNADRKIPNFIFKETSDPEIIGLTLEAKYDGDNVYEIIKEACSEKGVGFKITLDNDDQFVFELYKGTDRSYDQLDLPVVVFSDKFDNLINSNYVESHESFKNVTLVRGADKSTGEVYSDSALGSGYPDNVKFEFEIKRDYTAVGNTKGLSRREVYTDAQSISRQLENSSGEREDMPDAEYTSLLRQEGKRVLTENSQIISFEGEAETTIMFRYGEHFFNGDIVQVEDAYGHGAKARITELVTSDDTSGYSVYPTFVIVPDEEIPEGYLRLSSIQSDGNQYIDTGFKPDNNTRIIMDVEPLSSDTCGFFGVRSASSGSTDSYVVWLMSETSARSDFGSGQLQQTVSSILHRFTTDKNKNLCTFDGMPFENDEAEFTCANNLLLLTVNTNGTVDTRKLPAKLYSCQIYNNELLVRDFVPVKNDQDKVGLYDLVEKVFYPNAGTGAFGAET